MVLGSIVMSHARISRAARSVRLPSPRVGACSWIAVARAVRLPSEHALRRAASADEHASWRAFRTLTSSVGVGFTANESARGRFVRSTALTEHRCPFECTVSSSDTDAPWDPPMRISSRSLAVVASSAARRALSASKRSFRWRISAARCSAARERAAAPRALAARARAARERTLAPQRGGAERCGWWATGRSWRAVWGICIARGRPWDAHPTHPDTPGAHPRQRRRWGRN